MKIWPTQNSPHDPLVFFAREGNLARKKPIIFLILNLKFIRLLYHRRKILQSRGNEIVSWKIAKIYDKNIRFSSEIK